MAEKTVLTGEASLTISLSSQEVDYLQRWAKDQGYDAAPALIRSWVQKLILMRLESLEAKRPEPLFVEDWPLDMMESAGCVEKVRVKRRRAPKKSINFLAIQDQGQNTANVSVNYLAQLTEAESGSI